MSKMSRTRVWICFGLVMVIGCFAAGASNAALFGLFKGKSNNAAASSKVSSLIVFPFDQAQEAQVPDAMGANVAAALRTTLSRGTQYSPLLYNERLASIQRARADATIKIKEDVAPFSEDRAKPLKLARVLAADFFLTGSIEDIRFEPSKKVAEMTVSVELVDANTGRLMKTLLVTGRTPDGAAAANEQDVVALAAGDAVAKLKTQLLEEPKPETPAAAKAQPSAPSSVEVPKASASQPAKPATKPAAPAAN